MRHERRFNQMETIMNEQSPICVLAALLISVSAVAGTAAPGASRRFSRVFCWGRLTDGETARKYQEIGVTDVPVANPEQLALARKYGMTPYCGAFSARGPHRQVMTEEENAHFAYIHCRDLAGTDSVDRTAEKHRRRLETRHQYGGEPVATLDTLNDARLPCFSSDADYRLSKKAIDTICSKVEGVAGIYFDYIGYTNFKGCYCTNCLAAYQAYLAEKRLPDTQRQKDGFYRDRLVKYYNDMIDYVKSRHPDFKIVVHLYPAFLPEPLYGNRIKADFCGQTVAWYFPWSTEKIAAYTRVTVREQNKHFPGVRGVPFLGINRTAGSLWVKDAATLERELRTILAAGGDWLMVCNGKDMLDPGIDEVFKKYCGRD
jgi:hypothetical protein